jgi:predicted phosphoribosyltransferase
MSFRERKEYDGVLLQGKTVLVDNGIATRATILSAAQWLKVIQNCKECYSCADGSKRDNY